MSTYPDLVQFLASGVLDNNGDPNASGKVYVYTAGTTTAKTIWTDFAMSTPAAQPVVLDSRGCATLYGLGDYKFTIQTATASAVVTIDTVHLGY